MIQIIPGENIQTQVKVLKVNSGNWGVSLDLDIPAMGKKEFKFVDWGQGGPAPDVGSILMATLRPKRRSSYWMKQGSFIDNDSSDITGEEKPWQLDWECLKVEPVKTSTLAGPVPGNGAGGGAVFLDGNLRYRIDQEAINDRESVRMVLAHGAANDGNIYKDMATVLSEAETVAGWLNVRLDARLGGGMVSEAQQMGAVLTKVEEKDPVSDEIQSLKTRADLQDWVEGMGWSRDELLVPLKRAGYEGSKDYLTKPGNTVQGLASFLLAELGNGKGDAGW